MDVKYNGVKLTDNFIVGNISRPSPDFRPSSTTVDGRDGESFDGLTIGTRECSFVVTAIDKTKNGLQRAARDLMSLLRVSEPEKLVFTDENGADGTQLYRLAVPTGVLDYDAFIRAGQWTLRFIQHDPFLYGKQRSVVLKANTATKIQAGGGVPMDFVATAAPVGTWYKLEVVNGDFVKYYAPFTGGETLTIRTKNQTAKLAPALSTAKGLDTGSRFFQLDGDMTLKATHTTEITWRERWL